MKGKVPPEVVAEWKKRLGNQPIFLKTIKVGRNQTEHDFIFRWIDRKLHRRAQETLYQGRINRKFVDDEVAEMIFDNCVLWPDIKPEEKLAWPAGILQEVVKSIQEKSFFLETTLDGAILAPDFHTSKLSDVQTWQDIDPESEKKLIDKFGKTFGLQRVRFENWTFILRPMTRLDQSSVQSAEDMDIDILRRVVVWPEKVDWDIIPAGIIDRLGNVAMRVSGYDAEAEVEEL